MDFNGQIRINDFKMAALDNIEVAKNFMRKNLKEVNYSIIWQ